MKGLLLFFVAFVFCLNGNGQKPESFYYQALVRNGSGELVVSKPLVFRISILAGSASGVGVYIETQNATTNKEGLITLIIGNGSDKTGNFNTIDWNTDKYFLKVETDPTGGTAFTEMSTVQLLNIPFEAQKKTAKRASEIVIEDEFLLTRKYIGEFLDYRHTGPETSDGPNIIWIKTSMDKTFGKLSAYGKNCEFTIGDNLYLRRIFYSPGDVSGYWIYQIENDSSVYYRLSEFQYDKKVYVETLFLQ
jgi:hypothetical protein